MKIVEGGLPEEKAWRSLLLLAIGEEAGFSWQLGLSLAKANEGEFVAAVVVKDTREESISDARKTLARARRLSASDSPIFTVVIQSERLDKAVREIIHEAEIDLLVASADSPAYPILEQMPCAIAAVRGEEFNPLRPMDQDDDESLHSRALSGVLVPTSGGPNSVHALSVLLPLARANVKVTALYIAPSHLGEHEEALGRSRLRQTLNYIDAGDHIGARLINAPTVIDGIEEQATEEYDMVVIGASRESSFDRVVFGNIPAAVVEDTRKPVVIFREPIGRVGNLLRDLGWAMQNLVPRLKLKERTEAYVRIRRGARPDIDFYVLIGLAAGIAAFGLLANSAAVVIGAMLVAPLMSPIAGIGLAMVLGDSRFLRLSSGAVLRGAILALFMGLIVGLIPLKEPMTAEVLARTQPTLLDLMVALLSGMAVAFALTRSDAIAALPGVAIAAALVPPLASSGISFANGYFTEGAGALLLFATNLVAISVAAALVFLLIGFRPMPAQKARRVAQRRSAQVALVLLLVIVAILAYTTYSLAQKSAMEAHIREVTESGVEEITYAELVEINIGDSNEDILQLDLVVRSSRSIPHSAVVELQEFIATELQQEVALRLTVIPSTELDPFLPPTQTPTPVPTNTATSGPTPTPVPSDTPTMVPTPTETATATATITSSPTATATQSPTPSPPLAEVVAVFGLNFREEPDADSPAITFLPSGSIVLLLDGLEENSQGIWQQVVFDGQVGWLLAEFLEPLKP